jgi:5-methylcytosine-specific restriction protein A
MLKPRVKELEPRIKMLTTRTLKQKQEANGRTLALNGAAWGKLRTLVLSEQPLCADCMKQGLLTPATDVDHHDNDASNNERSNLVGLCHYCHSVKTARYEQYKRTGTWPAVKGCDVNGIPLDPTHPWRIAVDAEKSPEAEGHEPFAKAYARVRT